MCRVERARQHEMLNEPDQARAQLADAISFATRQHGKRARMDAALALLNARQAQGKQALRLKDIAAAETAFAAMRDEARSLAGTHDNRPDLIRGEAIALENLGDIQQSSGGHKAAADNYAAAASAVSTFIKSRADSLIGGRGAESSTITWLARLHRSAGQELAELPDQAGAVEQMKQSIGAVKDNNGDGPELDFEVAVSQAMLWRLISISGDPAEASAARADALATIGKIAVTPNLPKELAIKASNLRKAIEGETAPANEAASP